MPGDKTEPKEGCRFCGETLQAFLDLGMSPLCESYRSRAQLDAMEPFYPLDLKICPDCLLVQLSAYVPPEEIFSEYAYFSSFSDSWLDHARRFAGRMSEEMKLGPTHRVVELGSNDGYLLQYFLARNIPVLGIDPAANIVSAAAARNVPSRIAFFNAGSARALVGEGIRADLLVANNVLAQVPDLNSFVEGMRILLAPHGVATVEFPHLLKTIEGNQFDQIYHEHFSYFSALTAVHIFSAHGLRVFHVEELATHGGSLRLFVCHRDDDTRPDRASVLGLQEQERRAGLDRLETYNGFVHRVHATKRALLGFLIEKKGEGKAIVGYGAPGKGNTLLNFCGIRSDFLAYTVDRNPYKQGKYLPGTHIAIHAPEEIARSKPDYVLILPWNLKDEIITQLSYIRDWGGKFIVPIPSLSIL